MIDHQETLGGPYFQPELIGASGRLSRLHKGGSNDEAMRNLSRAMKAAADVKKQGGSKGAQTRAMGSILQPEKYSTTAPAPRPVATPPPRPVTPAPEAQPTTGKRRRSGSLLTTPNYAGSQLGGRGSLLG
jgi:hypothetical protein